MKRRVIILSVILALPFIASAQTLVKCGMTNPDECSYKDLVQLIQDVLNFLIYTLATPIAVLMIAFSGFEMVTSGGDQKKYDNAKKVLINILIGYAVMLAAFLIVKLIFSLFFPEDYSLLS